MGFRVPSLKRNLKEVRRYLYETVARCNGLKLGEVSDETPLNEAAMEVGAVLAVSFNQVVVINDFQMSIGQLLQELELK